MSQIPHRPAFQACALALAVVLLAAVLGQTMPRTNQDTAQFHDAGAQRNAMIAELKASNQKLAEIAALLKQIRDQSGPQSTEAEKRERPPR